MPNSNNLHRAVALLVDESESAARTATLEADSLLAVWWATPVECESAIQRRLRESSIDAAAASQARERLAVLAEAWHEVSPTAAVRELALRLLRTHPLLRATDGLQLAAALALDAAGHPDLRFACAEHRLATAAEQEGLACV